MCSIIKLLLLFMFHVSVYTSLDILLLKYRCLIVTLCLYSNIIITTTTVYAEGVFSRMKTKKKLIDWWLKFLILYWFWYDDFLILVSFTQDLVCVEICSFNLLYRLSFRILGARISSAALILNELTWEWKKCAQKSNNRVIRPQNIEVASILSTHNNNNKRSVHA